MLLGDIAHGYVTLDLQHSQTQLLFLRLSRLPWGITYLFVVASGDFVSKAIMHGFFVVQSSLKKLRVLLKMSDELDESPAHHKPFEYWGNLRPCSNNVSCPPGRGGLLARPGFEQNALQNIYTLMKPAPALIDVY